MKLYSAEVVKLAIHAALKMLWPQGRVGSTPTFGTKILYASSQTSL